MKYNNFPFNESKFAGATWWDILKAIYWRIVGCEHENEIDLGDEDGHWHYCYDCQTKL